MKKLFLKGVWVALACSSILLLSRCSGNDMLQPEKETTASKMPPPPPPAWRPAGAMINTNKVFTFVEQMPSFPGGQQALMQYLSRHIHYPTAAREDGISGTVVVQFVVNTDGTIHDVRTIGTKKGGGLEEESKRVVKNMPKWIPGRQKGQKVVVQINLPIRFVIQ